eukprot:7293058-Pyramimonas_sp.AAC.1
MTERIAAESHTPQTTSKGSVSEPLRCAPGITNSFENTNAYKLRESSIQQTQLENKIIGLRGEASKDQYRSLGSKRLALELQKCRGLRARSDLC